MPSRVDILRKLEAQRCKIYVHERKQPLAAHRQPRSWQHHQYAMEHYLAAAARASPWRVGSPSEADMTLVVANYSLFCVAGKAFARRANWYNMLQDRQIWPNASTARWRDGTVLIATQSVACGVPWADTVGSFRPRNTLLLQETSRGPETIVSPFVVSRPAWLVGDAEPPVVVPWAERKVLFFAGHVPKLYQSIVRYLIWKQLRPDPRVTAHSWTIQCTVGSYATCLQSNEQIWEVGRQIESQPLALSGRGARESGVVVHLARHCHGVCSNTTSCDVSRVRTPRQDRPTLALTLTQTPALALTLALTLTLTLTLALALIPTLTYP